ncbi:MAG: 6,7-dimethyl-8-ribityllumazine synthase [Gemmatimonadetes bacterium]|jgi:6,7-dimethyl-8-ribityllumazine synthase|nr:6,7-dimethyl-8-ribityllumazine synthase [Gemmatimonadota bacterium]
MAEFEGASTAAGRRFVVIGSRFNAVVTQPLVDGALDCLVRHGASSDDIDVVWVPGAWELAPAVARVLQSERYAAVVVCGAVIRGETPHFDFVAGEASRGLAALQGEFGVPIGFGLLTTDTLEQALQRAGGDHGNKGWDSALAAMQMADLFGQLDASESIEDEG